VNQETKEPVANASVFLLRDKSIGTCSNNSGNFKLNIPEYNANDIVVITCVGYEKKETAIDYIIRNKIITLLTREEEIEEVTITNNLSAEKILKIALRKFPRRYSKRRNSSDFTVTNYLYVDSTKEVVGAMKANGLINDYGYYLDSVEAAVKIEQCQFYGKIDPPCFTPIGLLKNDHDRLGVSLVYHIVDHFKVFWRVNPVFLSDVYFPNMKGHFSFTEDTTCAENFWIINAKDLSRVDYGYKLPENEFRKKYGKELKEFKLKNNYSPNNKLFVISENQIDSLFYSNLRKSLERGSLMVHNMILYVDKNTFAIHKAEYKITSAIDSAISFTNFIAHYSYLSNSNKLVISKLEIANKPSVLKLNSYIVFDFINIKTGRKANRIDSKNISDSSNPARIPSIDITNLDIEAWNKIKVSAILRPVLRETN